MSQSKISKDKLEGLVAGCLDLYENYGNSLIAKIESYWEAPRFSISPYISPEKEEISEEEKEKQSKQEELDENKRIKLEKINKTLEDGREKNSYKTLKSLEEIDSSKYNPRKNLAYNRWAEYSFIDKILKIVRDRCRKNQPNAGVFLDTNFPVLLAPTFSEMLVEFMRIKGLESKDVYTAANMDRRLFSKILSNTYYKPSRDTAISLCFALKLNIEETEDFLATAGFTLSRSQIDDIVIEYFIRTENYNINEIQEVVNEIEKLIKN